MFNDDFNDIVQNIIRSKKYKGLYKKTIEHNVKRCLEKYGKKQAERRARKILHQIWSAYYDNKPNFKHIYESFIDKLGINNVTESEIKERIIKILSIQSSTCERITILDNFYKQIFAVTGKPSSIIDHACGLNPLTYFWMNLDSDVKYQAYDIESDLIWFLNSIFEFCKLDNIEAKLGDVLIDEFGYADVVFMFKLLPILEQQEKGSSINVMKSLRCKYLVVSFPIKSLSGSEKGMREFYSNWFKKTIESEKWKFEEILFNTELVFVVCF
ncbi:TPA: hypothetical protein ENX78_06595 [Candidatus Poribacteria bacterium]|nr:hypothetical protein [Candidatus Poribacteria bacterium]